MSEERPEREIGEEYRVTHMCSHAPAVPMVEIEAYAWEENQGDGAPPVVKAESIVRPVLGIVTAVVERWTGPRGREWPGSVREALEAGWRWQSKYTDAAHQVIDNPFGDFTLVTRFEHEARLNQASNSFYGVAVASDEAGVKELAQQLLENAGERVEQRIAARAAKK